MRWYGEAPELRVPNVPDGVTCFVTGCCGFVGVNLVERLLASGWRVVGMDVSDRALALIESFPNSEELFTFIQGDVTDEEAVIGAVPDGCHFVFHLASNTAVRAEKNHSQNMTNIRGTEHIVSACRRKKVRRLVLTSSIAVYFPNTHDWESWFPPRRKKVVLSETSARSPDDFWVNYCRTKALQEKIVQDAEDVDRVIVQPSDIIGRFDERSWGRLMRMMAECRLVGVPRAELNFVNVQDVVEGHLRAAVAGRCGETYVLGGTMFSTQDLVQEMQSNIVRIVGRASCTPKIVPLWLLRLMGYLQEWIDDDPLAEANAPEADKSFPRETIFLLSSQHEATSEKAERELLYQRTTHDGVIRAIRQMADHALLHVEPLEEGDGSGTFRGSVRRMLLKTDTNGRREEDDDDDCCTLPVRPGSDKSAGGPAPPPASDVRVEKSAQA
eukprot:TRINITY_DN10081_c0_g1_i1.p1 TRINITY_DN10081_c0_g1~~TRINITY_DN10081_c0_g1_i1.p1  ORF type:complete len:441 (+),score=129.14 TRINITY_DN10081_c0_g1_i1:392-1714(+)